MFSLDYNASRREIEVVTCAVQSGKPSELERDLQALCPESTYCLPKGLTAWHYPATARTFKALEMACTPTATTLAYRNARRTSLWGDTYTKFNLEQNLAGHLLVDLLPHQVDYLAQCLQGTYAKAGCLNASEQGTGKTLMALALVVLHRALDTVSGQNHPVLIIGPKSLARQWQESLKYLASQPTWLDAADARLGTVKERVEEVCRFLSDGPEDKQGLRIAFINYELLPELAARVGARKEALPFKVRHLIFDESWRLRNPKSALSRAAISLVKESRLRCRQAFVQCLAGTPASRHPGELWVQLKLVKRADDFGWSYSSFCREYCDYRLLRLPGRDVEEPYRAKCLPLLAGVLGGEWFRATKETCLQLPPKQFCIISLEPTQQQLDWLRVLDKHGQVVLAGEGEQDQAEAVLPSKAVTLLRQHQICGGVLPKLAGGWQAAEWLRNNKADWLLKFLHELAEENRQYRCLVWCAYSAEVMWLVALLAQAGHQVHGVTGSRGPCLNSAEQLQVAKKGFNDRSAAGPQIIVAQVAALGAGHNLQAADHHVFWSNSWLVLQRTQAEDRSHRLGREAGAGVTYWDLCLNGTVDEEVLAAIKEGRDFQQRLGVDTTSL